MRSCIRRYRSIRLRGTAGELQTYERDDHEHEEEEPPWRPRLIEQPHAEDSRTDSADAYPHSVGRSDGQRARRYREQDHTQHDSRTRKQARDGFRKTVRVLQSNSPADFEQPCKDQIYPRHYSVERRVGPSLREKIEARGRPRAWFVTAVKRVPRVPVR